MATKQITTWDEFKAALTETITEDTTYEIMNDIDVSDIENIANTIDCISSGFRKAFNGNSHKINGLTVLSSLTNTYLFRFRTANGYIIFNQLSFSNFMIPSATLFGEYDLSSDGNGFIFRSCYFNGICNRFFRPAQYRYKTAFDKCSINIKINGFGVAGSTTAYYQTTLTNCYCIFNQIDKTTPKNIGTAFCGAKFTNCYIGGEWNSVYNSSFGFLGFDGYSGSNSVFNMKIIISNYDSSTTYSPAGNIGTTADKVWLINRDKIVQTDGETSIENISANTGYIPLTDSQLKSRTYIQENTNFPLYG